MTLFAEGVWSSPGESTVTFGLFQLYQSVTTGYMLRREPGDAMLLPSNDHNIQQEKRDLGSGREQILINGKRISGNSNNISPAFQWVRVTSPPASGSLEERPPGWMPAARARQSTLCLQMIYPVGPDPGKCTRFLWRFSGIRQICLV
jgi:hypothetical protein